MVKNVNEWIYVWKIPVGKSFSYIVGMEKSPGSRNDEYLNKSNTTLTLKNKVLSLQATEEFSTDHAIHAELKKIKEIVWDGEKGFGKLKDTREAFNLKGISETKFLEIISEMLTGNYDAYRRVKNFPLRPYQENLKNEVHKKFEHNRRVLLHLSTRGGKSFLSLKIAQNEGATNILILSPFPAAKSSFIEIAETHKDFEGWKYTDGKDLRNDTSFNGLHNIVFCSFQMFDDEKDKIKNLLSDVKFDFIIIDEMHNTSDSFRSSKILENFSNVKQLFISGTPFNDIESGSFTKDNTVELGFIDLMAEDKKSHQVGFPDLMIHNVSNVQTLDKIIRERNPELAKDTKTFDLQAIFDSQKAVESFFKWAFYDNNILANENHWTDDINFSDDKHILMFVPSVKGADFAKRSLEKIVEDKESSLHGFKILAASGMTDNNNEIDFSWMKNQEEKFNKFMEENRKTVIISCQKLTTGVTLPLLDTILLMRSCSSAEQFVQILFRTMTSAKNKKSASLYNFDYECTLKVLRKLVSIAKAENEVSQREAIEKLLSVVRLDKAIGDKNFDFEELKADEWLKELRDIPFSYIRENVFENLDIDVNLNDLRDADLTLNKELGQRNVTEDKKTKKQGSSSNGLSRKAQITTATTNDKLTESDKKKLLAIVQHIDHEIIMNNIKSFDELRSHLPSEIGESLRSAYEQLLDKNKTNVKDLIEDIWWKWDNDKLNLIENMSQYNNADKATPVELIEKMFNKLTHDDDAIYYDPCCGTGAIGLYLRSKGIDDDKIYMSDINPSHVEMCKKLGFKHVYQCDILAEKVNIEYKHMKIIMNPPFSGNLHLKILSHLIKLYSDAEVVNLSPIDWIMNPADNSNMQNFGNMKFDIEYVGLLKDLFESTDKATYHIGIYQSGDKTIESQRYDFISYDRINIIDYNMEHFIEKLKKCDSVSNHIKSGKLSDKYCYIVPKLVGNAGGKFDCFIWPKGSRWDRIFYKGLSEGKTPGEYKKKLKNVTNYTDFDYIEFDTEEEVENFKSTCKTKFMRFVLGIQSIDANLRTKLLPWLDYSHPWTDEMLYKYFGLNEEEIREIEKCI